MNSPVKILHLISHLGFGGTERQLYLSVKHLDPTRFESHVAVFHESPNENYESALERCGAVVHRLYRRSGNISSILYLHRLTRRLHFDIIHAWSFHLAIIATVLGARSQQPIRFGSLRNTLAHSRETMPSWMVFLALRSTSWWVVNATVMQQELSHEGIDVSRIAFIPNIIEDVTLDSGSVLRENGCARIASIGNLRPVKNHEAFIEVLSRVVREQPQAHGIIAGQEVETGSLARLNALATQRQVVDHLTFAGFVADVGSFLHSIDVLCLTSKSEGMPNVVLEAMQEGTAVVAAPVGAIPDLIRHGENGFIVSPENPDEFAASVLAILRDRKLKERIVSCAKETVRSHHRPDIVIPVLQEVYLKALKTV